MGVTSIKVVNALERDGLTCNFVNSLYRLLVSVAESWYNMLGNTGV